MEARWSSDPERFPLMDDDVTNWSEQLGQGDELAAQRVWHRYV